MNFLKSLVFGLFLGVAAFLGHYLSRLIGYWAMVPAVFLLLVIVVFLGVLPTIRYAFDWRRRMRQRNGANGIS